MQFASPIPPTDRINRRIFSVGAPEGSAAASIDGSWKIARRKRVPHVGLEAGWISGPLDRQHEMLALCAGTHVGFDRSSA
jgi:phosphate-selective porin